MKRIFLFTISLLFMANSSFGQDLEFPTNTPVWKEVHTTIAGPHNRYFAVCGDTIIDGTQYDRMLEIFVDANLQIINSVTLGGIRQEGPQVYLQYIGDIEEFLLYDFSLQQGDEITLKMPFGLAPKVRKVTTVETEFIEGKLRRVIHFEEDIPNCPYEPESWVEGIGSSYGLLNRGLSSCFGADLGSFMLCFQYNDEYVNFTLIECFLPQDTGPICGVNSTNEKTPSNNLLTVFPNPANNSISLELNGIESSDIEVLIYSSLGQQLMRFQKSNFDTKVFDISNLANGLYYIKVENEEGKVLGVSKFIKE